MKTPLLLLLEQHGAAVDDALERFMDDAGMYERYLRKLHTDPNLQALADAVMHNDAQTAQKAVHTLKGIADNLGLLPLVEISMDMFTEFRRGNADQAMQLFPRLQECANMFISLIEQQ